MRSARRSIPSFSLYGEGRGDVDFGQAVHIEDIPSRSKKYLWRIESHRHLNLSQCVLVTEGPVTVTLEETQRSFSGPIVILIPAGTVHGFRFQSETRGFVLTVDLPRILDNADVAHQAPIQALLAVPGAFELGFDPALAARIINLLECLLREYRRPERLPEPVAAWLACAALLTVAEGCKNRLPTARGSGSDLKELQSFRALVEAHFMTHWPVSRYAQKLKHSETTLNRLCLRLTGDTAFHLIQERLALEARRRLIYGGASVSGIAGELGFKDLAYFSRFFRRHSGTSPSAFRRMNGGGKVPTRIRIVQ